VLIEKQILPYAKQTLFLAIAIQLSPAIMPLGRYEAKLKEQKAIMCTRSEIEKMRGK